MGFPDYSEPKGELEKMESVGGGLPKSSGTRSASAGTSADRYDRQIRIWGEHGQNELRAASVLVLGSSAVAGEVLKNLVLPGIRRFVIIDDAHVTRSDLHNTMLSPGDLGKARAASMVRELLELNSDVEGASVHMSPVAYVTACEASVLNSCVCSRRVEENAMRDPASSAGDAEGTGPGESEVGLPDIFDFSLVIACQQPLDLVRRLSRLCGLEPVEQTTSSASTISVSHPICHNGGAGFDFTRCATTVPTTPPPAAEKAASLCNGRCCQRSEIVPLINVTSVGLLGVVRVCAGEYCLVERKGQSEGSVDLRLFDPFPELYEFAMEYDLNRLDDLAHAQVPFAVILIQALDRYRRTQCSSSSDACAMGEPPLMPLPQEARGQLEAIIQGMRRHPDEVNFDEAMANVFRILKPHSVSQDTAEVIEQASCPSFKPVTNINFWTLARALAAFQRACKKLPVQGTLPDMTSDTQSFIRLQQVYSKRAEGDCNAIKASVAMIQEDSITLEGDGQGRRHGGVTNSQRSCSPPLRCSQLSSREGSVGSAFRRRDSERSGASLDVEKFCRNAYNLKVIRYRSIGEEFNPLTVNREMYGEAVAGLRMEESDEGIPLLPWYLALWACHRFAARNGFFPGVRAVGWLDANSKQEMSLSKATTTHWDVDKNETTGRCLNPQYQCESEEGEQHRTQVSVTARPPEMSLDAAIEGLKREVNVLLSEINVPDLTVDERIIRQMVAFGGAEIHTTAAIVGGVAAQEAVKLICRQFEPINNTFIWNGIERKAEVLEL
ncbi:ThiF family protein [Toxoplasma gondii TgCatPRC2]|uniref:ThiF family protein n=1 Tax=Toxoplasma gondii TgCatPRC2 TaxID=1130821 RepID=A0A151HQC2_TOXGO|nr:ThiF family protein [Toxoplasma gondii TgCatPRC2]